MSRKKPSHWRRWKHLINGLLLVAPAWFLWQSLNPVFPPSWEEKKTGPFSAAPTPADTNPPYAHDDGWQKDFSVSLCRDCGRQLRSAFLSVGVAPQEPDADLHGVLHGHGDLLHAHVPWPETARAGDRLWLQLETWSGSTHTASWALPAE